MACKEGRVWVLQGFLGGWMGGCGYFWGQVTVTDYHYAFIVAAQCHCVGQDARIRRNPS